MKIEFLAPFYHLLSEYKSHERFTFSRLGAIYNESVVKVTCFYYWHLRNCNNFKFYRIFLKKSIILG